MLNIWKYRGDVRNEGPVMYENSDNLWLINSKPPTSTDQPDSEPSTVSNRISVSRLGQLHRIAWHCILYAGSLGRIIRETMTVMIGALHHEQQISEGLKAHVTNSGRKITVFGALDDLNFQILSSEQQIETN